MSAKKEFYKKSPADQIWWVANNEEVGVWEFSFDKKTVFNMFRDYPYELTAAQKEIFDRENPFWEEFFRGRPPRPSNFRDDDEEEE